MHNVIETDYDHEYFSNYPYAVEIFVGDTCEDTYRTNNLSHAQAKFDSWTSDLQGERNVEVKMFKYNTKEYGHEEINYQGEII